MERQLNIKSRTKVEKLTKSILKKWNEQRHFIRFLDGNTHNCVIGNLCRVSILEAMDNIDWKVDWEMNLTETMSTTTHTAITFRARHCFATEYSTGTV